MLGVRMRIEGDRFLPGWKNALLNSVARSLFLTLSTCCMEVEHCSLLSRIEFASLLGGEAVGGLVLVFCRCEVEG